MFLNFLYDKSQRPKSLMHCCHAFAVTYSLIEQDFSTVRHHPKLRLHGIFFWSEHPAMGQTVEKSWVVKLATGFLIDDHVKSPQCKGCNSTTEPILRNNHDGALFLFGCPNRKCRHTLIRFKFPPESPFALPFAADSSDSFRVLAESGISATSQ